MKIIYLIILLLSVVGSQYTVRAIVKRLNEKIKKSIPKIKNSIPDLKKEADNFWDSSDFKKEVTNLYLIFEKKKKLGSITIIIGVIEIFIFGGLTVLLFKYSNAHWSKHLMTIAKFAGAWIALKIFGSYRQWSGAVLGRAYFYVFLICSIINITLSAVIGYYVFSLLI